MLTRNISRNWTVLIFVCTALFRGSLVFGAESAALGTIEIQTYTNSEMPVYIMYRFAVAKDGRRMEKTDWELYGAKIEWDVIDHIDDPKRKKSLSVSQMEGAGSFSANARIHKALMGRIFSQWPVSDFDGVCFGPLGGPPDWSWNIAVAVASAKSDDYKDYKANYPHSRIMGLNGLYVKLVDETKAYRPLQEVFREFGADIEFVGGEHTMTSRAEDLPFYPQLQARGISRKTRVIYDGGNGFSIKPWHNKAGAANGSQPIRSETNRTSSAAGSRR